MTTSWANAPSPSGGENISRLVSMTDIRSLLRFYFITDDGPSPWAPVDQARAALFGGATLVQYRNKGFRTNHMDEVRAILHLCHRYGVPFLVNDNIALARTVGADGVHLGQDDAPPARARQVLGAAAIIGITISNQTELDRTDLSGCDYAGSGPVFATGTKADAKPVRGLDGLRRMVDRISLPVVAIGGICADNAARCLEQGAAGVAVISAVSRADEPRMQAFRLAKAVGVPPRAPL
jgi:thiamine-phosphate pyrophosphorylase